MTVRKFNKCMSILGGYMVFVSIIACVLSLFAVGLSLLCSDQTILIQILGGFLVMLFLVILAAKDDLLEVLGE